MDKCPYGCKNNGWFNFSSEKYRRCTICHGKVYDEPKKNKVDNKPASRLYGIPALRLKLENELAVMPDTYAPQWPFEEGLVKFDRLEWVARWGEGYLANDNCSPRGMASIRSKRGLFKHGKT